MSHHAEFDEELDLTPLIDVAFLLQIFFMVTATIEMAASITMPRAKHGKAPDLQTAVYLTIFYSPSGPELFLSNGKRENGPARLEEISPYVRQAVSSGNRTIVIKADQAVASGFVEDVARAAGEVEGIERFLVGVIDSSE